MRIFILIWSFFLFSQSVLGCELPSGWLTMHVQGNSNLQVVAKLPEPPIRTGEQFSIDVMVCGATSGIDQVIFDATMPTHKHGMNYLPEVSKLEEKTYRASGMFFHMPGKWQITLEVQDQETHRFYLDVSAR